MISNHLSNYMLLGTDAEYELEADEVGASGTPDVPGTIRDGW